MVVMVCAQPFHSCRSAYWTFNVKLLQDVHFKDAFRLVWGKLEMEKHSYLNIRQWWDCTKSQIHVFCQQYCLYTTCNASGLISVLKSEILDHEQKAGTSVKNDQQLREKKDPTGRTGERACSRSTCPPQDEQNTAGHTKQGFLQFGEGYQNFPTDP